ncbi:hypothetical protein ABZP36_016702 [Zizania latifolia]
MQEPQRMHRDAGGELPAAETDPLLEPSPPSPSPAEIADEEIDAASAACCRICLESESEPGDELISPCMCKGTQQFVHRYCLDHWRSVKEGAAFSHCTTCKAQFHLRVECLEDNICRKMKFRLFVARDVVFVFLAVQTVRIPFSLIALCLKHVNSSKKLVTDFCVNQICSGVVVFFVLVGLFGLIVQCSSFNTSDPCLAGCRNCCYGWGILDFPASIEACFALAVIFVIVFAILGVAYGFLAATVAVQRILQRHYHILTKKELTKEYVVEDLHGCYVPPKMDPEHEQRLKTLKLM